MHGTCHFKPVRSLSKMYNHLECGCWKKTCLFSVKILLFGLKWFYAVSHFNQSAPSDSQVLLAFVLQTHYSVKHLVLTDNVKNPNLAPEWKDNILSILKYWNILYKSPWKFWNLLKGLATWLQKFSNANVEYIYIYIYYYYYYYYYYYIQLRYYATFKVRKFESFSTKLIHVCKNYHLH